MNPPLWARRAVPQPVRNLCRPLFDKLQTKIVYSRSFYEREYHCEQYRLHERDLGSLMAEWEATGWKKKLFDVLDQIGEGLNPSTWLEPACHHGKTAFWLAERFPQTYFYMFDFSGPAVEFCRRFNPIPDRSIVWQGDITSIRRGEAAFDNFFDCISLLDVTEHLPPHVYRAAISELHRVARPGGYLLLKQGHEILPEHINILPEHRLVSDFLSVGFELLHRLPERHYLLRKPV